MNIINAEKHATYKPTFYNLFPWCNELNGFYENKQLNIFKQVINGETIRRRITGRVKYSS